MEKRDCFIRLNKILGLGSVTIHRLLSACETPEKVFDLSPEAIRQILGRYATEEVLREFHKGPSSEVVEKEWESARRADVQILTLLDDHYPELLKEISDPPPVLYVKGVLLKEDFASVAMVGTRLPSPYGVNTARQLAGELARSRLTIVSGLAEGIDAASHEGALEADGRTIAVLGHGLSTLYPAFHRKLADRIVEKGALVSEFPMEFPPIPGNFPRRNRVIAGLSLGTVVVEAPAKSGALITAREAMEQGREVFAVPGSVSSAKSRGCHRLLRDGAKLVEGPGDVLEELAPHLKERVNLWKQESYGVAQELAKSERLLPLAEAPLGLTKEESALFEAIPVGTSAAVDRLVHATEMAPARLLSILTALELKGLIYTVPGQGYTRAS